MPVSFEVARERLPDYVIGYIENPRETLRCELKPWIDPGRNRHDEYKVVKTCIGMYNNDGGLLLVGVSDDGAFEEKPEGYQPEVIFTQDSVQSMIFGFIDAQLPVDVFHVVNLEGQNSVVAIIVPPGVTTPIICTTDTELHFYPRLRRFAIYTRSLLANGVPSTTVASQVDLEGILHHCHNNRVTDIGRFLREHLTQENIQVFQESVNATAESPEETPAGDLELEDFASDASALVQAIIDRGEEND
ncbi:MAG: helix-turn-helix domain-containing protein [bacterium]